MGKPEFEHIKPAPEQLAREALLKQQMLKPCKGIFRSQAQKYAPFRLYQYGIAEPSPWAGMQGPNLQDSPMVTQAKALP